MPNSWTRIWTLEFSLAATRCRLSETALLPASNYFRWFSAVWFRVCGNHRRKNYVMRSNASQSIHYSLKLTKSFPCAITRLRIVMEFSELLTCDLFVIFEKNGATRMIQSITLLRMEWFGKRLASTLVSCQCTQISEDFREQVGEGMD